MALLGGLAVPPRCPGKVLGNPAAVGVALAQQVLRICVALAGGVTQIAHRALVIPRHAGPVVERGADGILGARLATRGGGVDPLGAGLEILVDAAAGIVSLAELVGGGAVAPGA